MSKKSRKSQSVAVEAPVLVSDVTPVAEVAAEVAAAEIAAPEAEVAAALPAAEVATEVAAPEVAPAEIATPKNSARKYPREGGKCWQVWNACDELRATGKYVTVKDARDIATVNGWNLSNASQEFYAWKKFREIA